MVETGEFLAFFRWWARAIEVEASCESLCSGSECGMVLRSEMGIGAAEMEDEREKKREMNTMQDEGRGIVKCFYDLI